jgi:type VI secretion system protein ImpE
LELADADALLREGDISGARAALVDVVRARPSDAEARMFLFQLLAIAGEWDKARTQVQTLAQLSAEAQMLAAAYGQSIEAEATRREVFAGRQRVDILANPDGWLGELAAAIEHFSSGRDDDGVAARDAAFDAVPDVAGRLNDTAFDWIADADSRFGPAFEAIVAGRYGLLPFDAITKITSKGPQDLRDLVWLPVQVWMRSGQSISAFLPARYPGTETSPDSNEQLARATGWHATAWGETGRGQHLWSLSDGSEHGILSLRTLEFD